MSLKSIVIMCNGPSLRNVDLDIFSGVDTFGLNYAYKYYYKNNWWPTYHGSFDYLSNRREAASYSKMSLEKNPIKRFFYVSNLSNSKRFTHVKLNEAVKGWNNSEKSFDNFYAFGNSGTNACSVAVCMGYNNIILVGADCSQVEIYDGVEHINGLCRMTETPKHNPNYWFDYYFEKGDVFNKPNKGKFHEPWWEIFANMANKNNIRVTNCSEISTLKCFEKGNLEEEIGKIS